MKLMFAICCALALSACMPNLDNDRQCIDGVIMYRVDGGWVSPGAPRYCQATNSVTP